MNCIHNASQQNVKLRKHVDFPILSVIFMDNFDDITLVCIYVCAHINIL